MKYFNQRNILFLKSFFSQECFEILTRSTKVLREEYLDRHEKARREIERRCASLEAKKSQQHMTLVKLTQVCLSITSNFFVKLKYISFYYNCLLTIFIGEVPIEK